ncbi:MAG: hypothetical protein ACI4J7_09265 [Ruminiclostridium sp.]
MTLGEIKSAARNYNKYRSERDKQELINFAFCAYNCAYLSRVSSFPSSITKAFPALFGRTAEGGVSTADWRESKRAMLSLAEKYNENFRRKAGVKSGDNN